MTELLGVDIGATGIKAALFDPELRAREVVRAPTPQDDPTGMRAADVVADLAERLSGGASPAGLGLAAPGVIDQARGAVVRSVNLGWDDVPLRDLVAERTGLPIAFGHDVRLGGWAEFELGAARGHDDAVFVPIGTGISLAIRIAGQVAVGGGWAGEIGIMPASPRGRETGRSLEDIASARGLARRLGVDDGEEVVARLVAGDHLATQAWSDAVEALGDALAWTTAIVAPHIIVVGGGLSRAGDLLLTPLAAAIEARLPSHPAPRLRVAAFGDLAACHGAALLAQRSIP